MTLNELFDNDCKQLIAEQLIETIENVGLGATSKADFEALIYHIFNKNKIKDTSLRNFDWVKILKVTPTKLRSLQQIASVKYQDFSDTTDNWNLLIAELEKNKIEIEDIDKGNIKILISNAHVRMFIEKFYEDKGLSVDYNRNPNQLIIKFENFILLVDIIKALYFTESLEENWEIKLKEQIFADYSNELKDLLTSKKTIIEYLRDKSKDAIVSEAVKFTFISFITSLLQNIGKN